MKFIKSRLFRLIVIAISLILIVVLSQSILSFWQRRDVVRQRAAELARVKTENQDLQRKLGEANSPEFIERQAREKLGLVRLGESVVLLPSGTEAAKLLEEVSGKPLPNWREWWRLFF